MVTKARQRVMVIATVTAVGMALLVAGAPQAAAGTASAAGGSAGSAADAGMVTSGDSYYPPPAADAARSRAVAPAAAMAAAAQFPAIAAANSCRKSRTPYPDVSVANSACDNILWLSGLGITKPASGHYQPRSSVTRGAMAAFLFRLTHLGVGSPRCTSRPFADVPVGSTFCGYIRWAKNNGIAYGYSGNRYGPSRPVTRGAMAAYLYRIANPGVAAPHCHRRPFTDVGVHDTFCGVITWMKSNGITYGVGGGKYGTKLPVTRQAMASFLHRISDNMLRRHVAGRGARHQPAVRWTLQGYVPDGGGAIVNMESDYRAVCQVSGPGSHGIAGCVGPDAPRIIHMVVGSQYHYPAGAFYVIRHEFSHTLQFRWAFVKPAMRSDILNRIGWEKTADCMAYQLGATVRGTYIARSGCTGSLKNLATDILNWRNYY